MEDFIIRLLGESITAPLLVFVVYMLMKHICRQVEDTNYKVRDLIVKLDVFTQVLEILSDAVAEKKLSEMESDQDKGSDHDGEEKG